MSEAQPERSLADAIACGEQVYRKVAQAAALLPKHSEAPAPATLNDALLLVQQQDEERRRKEALKKEPRTKGKHGAPTEQAFPGATIGAGRERSAFWMIVEVGRASRHPPPCCQQLFRHGHSPAVHRLKHICYVMGTVLP